MRNYKIGKIDMHNYNNNKIIKIIKNYRKNNLLNNIFFLLRNIFFLTYNIFLLKISITLLFYNYLFTLNVIKLLFNNTIIFNTFFNLIFLLYNNTIKIYFIYLFN